MPSRTHIRVWLEGWRGVALIAITYIYFLIFAQFGFLKRLTELGVDGDSLKTVMGAMAAGGVAMSLLAWRFEHSVHPAQRLQVGLLGCALAAGLSLLSFDRMAGAAIAGLIGVSLGLLTVTLVTHLPIWLGTRQPLLKIGLGVGLAYLICNCPWLFAASGAGMASFSAGLCGLAIVLAGNESSATPETRSEPVCSGVPPFWLVLGSLTALVWLDSAAFYIIQNTPALKSATWEGVSRLWQNGAVHFLAALGGGAMLSRLGLFNTLTLAFVFLGSACLLLLEPGRGGVAAVLYPVGVSFYSVALVAYPAFLAAKPAAPGRSIVAGRLYAVAGWVGSGLGIGMAENLRRVPPGFVFATAGLFLAFHVVRLFEKRRREVTTTGVILLVALGLQLALPAKQPAAESAAAPNLAERGRAVYIAEGCIHCHSQYVRPNTRDELIWGPASEVTRRRAEEPPLIGNRRQGPDLAEVGNRRSVLWLQAHFANPAMLSHGSTMPGYAHLFADERGDALVAYLQSLGGSNLVPRLAMTQKNQRLSEVTLAEARSLDARTLVSQHCTTCHGTDGLTRQTWHTRFKRLPPDFKTGPFLQVPVAAPPGWRVNRIAGIIKFGIAGTDMPGHEYLAANEIAAMAMQIASLSSGTNHESAFDRR